MKQALKRCLLALLVIMLALPVLPANVISAAAKKPTLSPAKITLVGEGATNNLKLNNVDMSKVKRLTWYSQNEKVAIAEPTSGDKLTGKVIAVGKGKTNVRVKITYKDGSVVRPNCSVTVQIKAKEVEISNKKLNANSEHTIVVGESYDFNRKLTPSNANDKTYWFIEDLGKDLATVDTKGIVRALKSGLVRLTAKASLTKAGAGNSEQTDSVLINIVEKSAQVVKVELVDTTTLKVTFNNAIKPDTVLKDKKLLDTVKIVPLQDSKGQNAKELGELTGSLSTDGKELTINTTIGFNGLYRINLSNQIKSTDGLSLVNYIEDLELYDNKLPYFLYAEPNETGLKVTLHFSEPINISQMKVETVRVAKASDPAALPLTLSILGTTSNYTLSQDRKALQIDLSGISSYDHNKKFEVLVSGIRDDAGNLTATYPHALTFEVDTSPRPQARLTSVKRTGMNELTATFDRAIQYGGTLQVKDSYDYVAGVVDAEDNKKVKFTISPSSALLTGMRQVSIGNWNGYNVAPGDYTSNQTRDWPVDFTIEVSLPEIVEREFSIMENGDYQWKLVYNKPVTVGTSTGSLIGRVITANNDRYNNQYLSYIATVKENVVTLVLRKEQVLYAGVYTVTLPMGFVRDSYNNQSNMREVTFSKNADISSKLPAPKSVGQKADDPSTVYVVFGNKVDVASAENPNNYSIHGTIITKAELVENHLDGATVALTIAPNTITLDMNYLIRIFGISGYHNTYTAMDLLELTVFLKKNTAPSIMKTEYVKPNTIILTFTDSLKGTPSFQVIQNNRNFAITSAISDRQVIIKLDTMPTSNVVMEIKANNENYITDINGNVSVISTQLVVPN